MEIPLGTQVECTDGFCGTSEYVLINPVIDEITHLVVRAEASPHKELIVPVDYIYASIAESIKLKCSKAEFEQLEPFTQTDFIEEKQPDYGRYRGYGSGSYYFFPYIQPELKSVYKPVVTKFIPEGDLAVKRGAKVKATDGEVGRVDEFVVDPDTGRITHMVMREGHLWGKKDVIVPISDVGESRGETVSLKIDKHQIEALPTFPVHRHWS